MKFRELDGAEMLVLHCLWGPGMWKALHMTKVVDGVFLEEDAAELVKDWQYDWPTLAPIYGRPAFVSDMNNKAPWRFIFCPRGQLASLAHEVGHAVHDTLYPESRGWSWNRAEAFALLADVNAQRWRTLEPHERKSFGEHFWTTRRAPEYRAALKWAWELRRLPLKAQMELVASGPELP